MNRQLTEAVRVEHTHGYRVEFPIRSFPMNLFHKRTAIRIAAVSILLAAVASRQSR
jgi:hypothetical protein